MPERQQAAEAERRLKAQAKSAKHITFIMKTG